jgi:hypothetical protein
MLSMNMAIMLSFFLRRGDGLYQLLTAFFFPSVILKKADDYEKPFLV